MNSNYGYSYLAGSTNGVVYDGDWKNILNEVMALTMLHARQHHYAPPSDVVSPAPPYSQVNITDDETIVPGMLFHFDLFFPDCVVCQVEAEKGLDKITLRLGIRH